MSETIISQLKEYATIAADDMAIDKTGHDFTEDLQAAFQRAMDFSQLICPACWVKDNETSSLNISNSSDTTESYRCDKCGFNEELAKD
jgi:predicted RNA-binding Zn-ribbon protein involved in translation (DUF1610 family)